MLLKGKQQLIDDFSNPDQLANNPTLEANYIINILEIYLFASDEVKESIKAFSTIIRKKCEMWERKLVVGVVEDPYIARAESYCHTISMDTYSKNIRRLIEILKLHDFLKIVHV